MTNSKALGLSELASKANRQIRLEKSRLTALRALIDSLKYPVWMKDEHGRMVVINKAYTDKFGIQAHEYEGKFDVDVWPQHIAEYFKTNDAEALQSDEHIEAFEKVETSQGTELLYIIKTKLEIDGLIYVKGEAFKVDDMRTVLRIYDGG